MGRLVDEDAAALGVPAASPGVGSVVREVAPAIHLEDAQRRRADLPRVDRRLHPTDRLVPPPLADDAERHGRPLRRGEHRVAIGEARRHRLLDQDMGAGLGREDRRPGVERVRRGDRDGLGPRLVEHPGDIGEGAPAIGVREGSGALGRGVADGDQLRLGEVAERQDVGCSHLAAADQGGPESGHWGLRRVRHAGHPIVTASRRRRSARRTLKVNAGLGPRGQPDARAG